MSKSPIFQKFKALLPYFLLALAIIIVFRVSGSLGIFATLIGRAWRVISPFFYGFMLAYLINIPRAGIQHLLEKINSNFILKRAKMLSIIFVFVFLILLMFLILSLIIPAVIDSLAFFVAHIPQYMESVQQVIESFNNLNLFELPFTADEIAIFDQIENMLGNFGFDDIWAPIDAIMGAAAAIFGAVIAFISSIYILVEKDKFRAYLIKLLNIFATDEIRDIVIEVFRGLNKNFRQYIRTQTIDGMILGTLATIFLFILGSPFALVLGIMLGFVNYIPYFGSIFGTIIAVLVVTFTQGLTMGVVAALTLLIIQQIDANFIQPRLMSGSFSLSPLLIIISITIGGAIMGILGMIVAIPIVAVLKDFASRIVEYYERKKFGTPDDIDGQMEIDLQSDDSD